MHPTRGFWGSSLWRGRPLQLYLRKGPLASPLCSRRDDLRVWLSPCLISSRETECDHFTVTSALKRSFISVLGTENSARGKLDSWQEASGLRIPLLPPRLSVCWELPKAILSVYIPWFWKAPNEMVVDDFLRNNLSNLCSWPSGWTLPVATLLLALGGWFASHSWLWREAAGSASYWTPRPSSASESRALCWTLGPQRNTSGQYFLALVYSEIIQLHKRKIYENKNCGIYGLNEHVHFFFFFVLKMYLTQKSRHITASWVGVWAILKEHLNISEKCCRSRMVLDGDLCFLFSLISFCNTKVHYLLLCVFPISVYNFHEMALSSCLQASLCFFLNLLFITVDIQY